MSILISRLLELNVSKKFLIIIFIDFLICSIVYLSGNINFFPNYRFIISYNFSLNIYLISCVFIIIFYIFNVYGNISRYSDFSYLLQISKYLVLYIFLFILLVSLYKYTVDQSISIKRIIYIPIIISFFVLVERIFLIHLFKNNQSPKTNTAIFGAGNLGSLLSSFLTDYNIILFIDEDEEKIGRSLNTKKIYAPDNIKQLLSKFKIKNIIVAISNLTNENQQRIKNIFTDYKININFLSNINQLVMGKDIIENLELSDFFDTKKNFYPKIEYLKNQIVFITGAGGSIGRELSIQVLKGKPSKLILLDHSELSIYNLRKKIDDVLKILNIKIDIYYKIGSINDLSYINLILSEFKPDIIDNPFSYPSCRSKVFLKLIEGIFKIEVSSVILPLSDKIKMQFLINFT